MSLLKQQLKEPFISLLELFVFLIVLLLLKYSPKAKAIMIVLLVM